MPRWSLVLFASVAAVVGFAVPAAAHGGESDIEVVSSAAEAGGIRYEVRVTYENDGDPIGAATVTAVVTDATGVAQAPVALVYSEDGRYSALVPSPVGSSTVRFSVAEPEGALDVAQTLAAPSTAAPTTVTAAPATPPTFVPATSAPSAGGDSVTRGSAPVVEENDSGRSTTVVVIVAAVVLALAAVVVVSVRRGTRGGE